MTLIETPRINPVPHPKQAFWGLMSAQFLGAFNDNLLRFGSILLFLTWIPDPVRRNNAVSLSAAVFGIPFLLFSLQAGRIADRWAKKRVIVWVKAAELIPVVMAGLGAWSQSPFLVLASLFLLASQSAFFGPPKYSILPELFPESGLGRANGWMNVFTFIAILAGSIVATQLEGKTGVLFTLMVLVSGAGILSARLVDSPPAARPGQPIPINPFPEMTANWKLAGETPFLLKAFFASTFFWFSGAVTQINTFIFVEKALGGNQRLSGVILALAVAGICAGSMAGALMLKGKISVKLAPAAALGMGASLLDLFLFSGSPIRAMADGFLIGFFSGLYIVPINAFIQARSPEAHKGRLWGMVNLLNFVGILGASVFLWVTGSILQLNPAEVFGALGGLSLVMGAALPWIFRTGSGSSA